MTEVILHSQMRQKNTMLWPVCLFQQKKSSNLNQVKVFDFR